MSSSWVFKNLIVLFLHKKTQWFVCLLCYLDSKHTKHTVTRNRSMWRSFNFRWMLNTCVIYIWMVIISAFRMLEQQGKLALGIGAICNPRTYFWECRSTNKVRSASPHVTKFPQNLSIIREKHDLVHKLLLLCTSVSTRCLSHLHKLTRKRRIWIVQDSS
jgi:hypothetical protein